MANFDIKDVFYPKFFSVLKKGYTKKQFTKDLFSGIASMERQHLNTLTAIEQGGNTSGGSGVKLPQAFSKAPTDADGKTDKYLCGDLLSTEKHASHLYDACIFEFRDDAVRQTLNHIQKEEQDHGKLLYDYMAVNGMYA